MPVPRERFQELQALCVCVLLTSLLGNVTTTLSQAFICRALLMKATCVGLLLNA